jgi:precorrin-4/cobalt-precorrin-4 C11-methyltransferase
VHFIGAGPGAPDLITVRGRELIARCPVCLFAGSLVPKALLDHCPSGARIVDTAPMSLDEIVAECRRATDQGQDVARLHSGDLSIWSALGEQHRRLVMSRAPPRRACPPCRRRRALPGSPPEVAQSVVLTRTSGRARPCRLARRRTFAATGATLVLHLSIRPRQGRDLAAPMAIALPLLIARAGPTSALFEPPSAPSRPRLPRIPSSGRR